MPPAACEGASSRTKAPGRLTAGAWRRPSRRPRVGCLERYAARLPPRRHFRSAPAGKCIEGASASRPLLLLKRSADVQAGAENVLEDGCRRVAADDIPSRRFAVGCSRTDPCLSGTVQTRYEEDVLLSSVAHGPRLFPTDTPMPIRPHLDGQKFDSETIRVMGLAFEMALVALRLADRGDLANDVLARKIMDLAKGRRARSRTIVRGGVARVSRAAAASMTDARTRRCGGEEFTQRH